MLNTYARDLTRPGQRPGEFRSISGEIRQCTSEGSQEKYTFKQLLSCFVSSDLNLGFTIKFRSNWVLQTLQKLHPHSFILVWVLCWDLWCAMSCYGRIWDSPTTPLYHTHRHLSNLYMVPLLPFVGCGLHSMSCTGCEGRYTFVAKSEIQHEWDQSEALPGTIYRLPCVCWVGGLCETSGSLLLLRRHGFPPPPMPLWSGWKKYVLHMGLGHELAANTLGIRLWCCRPNFWSCWINRLTKRDGVWAAGSSATRRIIRSRPYSIWELRTNIRTGMDRRFKEVVFYCSPDIYSQETKHWKICSAWCTSSTSCIGKNLNQTSAISEDTREPKGTTPKIRLAEEKKEENRMEATKPKGSKEQASEYQRNTPWKSEAPPKQIQTRNHFRQTNTNQFYHWTSK